MHEIYLKMAQNNAWANATLYQAIAAVPASAATQPAPGFFATLAATMNHIYEVDLYYVDALQAGGRGRSVYRRIKETALTRLAHDQAAIDTRLIAFCSALTPQDLPATRRTERPTETCTETVQALLLHLFQHQVHHRGQAHVQLHAVGGTPPQLDEFHLAFERAPSARAYWP
ncbi:DinB family protein [Roseobacter sp.]|uniref:DinB family protein n=1 Tax=Roseobacter sp. TaxID=1907202 RepID=UPI003298D36B